VGCLWRARKRRKGGKKGAGAPGWRSPFIPVRQWWGDGPVKGGMGEAPHIGGSGRGPTRWMGGGGGQRPQRASGGAGLRPSGEVAQDRGGGATDVWA
jgi:hypothetical protein